MKKNEKRKKDIVDILVYIAMGCFLLLIILPPVLRLVMPKEKEEESHREEVAALICNKQDITYKTTIRTNYKNNRPMIIKMTYTDMPEMTNLEGVPYKTIVEQLKTINGIIIEEKEETTNITISEAVLTKNLDNPVLKDYVKDLEHQHEYYEKEQMTCNRY